MVDLTKITDAEENEVILTFISASCEVIEGFCDAHAEKTGRRIAYMFMMLPVSQNGATITNPLATNIPDDGVVLLLENALESLREKLKKGSN